MITIGLWSYAMARLIYSTLSSLDHYVADRDGKWEFAEPDPEVHAFVNDMERPIGTYLYGRRVYEVMAVWETLEDPAPEMRDYAELWRAAEKIVYSRTLRGVTTSRTTAGALLRPRGGPDAQGVLGARPRHRRPDARRRGDPRRAGRRVAVPALAGTRGRRQTVAAGRDPHRPGTDRHTHLRQRHRLPALPHAGVSPPKPMLAKLVAEIPPGLFYEPKWDGFRAIVVRDGDAIELHSRNGKPMARYFPDLVAALRASLPSRCVVDGEIVVIGSAGRLDFFALQQRVHPAASRVDRLAAETPASFIAFDLLSLDEADLHAATVPERRAALESLFAGAPPPLFLTPVTRDERLAREWFERFEGAGLDGVIAKDGTHPYRPGVRAMFKVKHQRTVDCVVCGYRIHKTHADAIGSLLLGLHQDGDGTVVGEVVRRPAADRRDGVVPARPSPRAAGRAAPARDRPSTHPWGGGAREQREGNRWNPAREQQFVALAPERVVEVRYDHMDGGFLRHPATFLRWRPDRDAASCGFAQLEQPAGFDVAEIIR